MIHFIKEWDKDSTYVGTILGDTIYHTVNSLKTKLLVTQIVKVTLTKDKLVVEGFGMPYSS